MEKQSLDAVSAARRGWRVGWILLVTGSTAAAAGAALLLYAGGLEEPEARGTWRLVGLACFFCGFLDFGFAVVLIRNSIRRLSRAAEGGSGGGLAAALGESLRLPGAPVRMSAPGDATAEMVRCYKCRAFNDASARTCVVCGILLRPEKRCPSCRAVHAADAEVCASCGAAFAEA